MFLKYFYSNKLPTIAVMLVAIITLVFSNSIKANAAAPSFSVAMVVSDSNFASTRAFPTEQSVQDYLAKVNSPLTNYSENGKKASNIIFNAANGLTSTMYGIKPSLNPGLLLAFLEKEQSLLTIQGYNTATDPEKRIATAMGYGCPDSRACDPDYQGFNNQVNWGAFQLQYNFNGAIQGSSKVAPFIPGTTINIDDYRFNLSNAATAAIYRYTPHAYPGNYNLWKILIGNGWGVDSTTYSYQTLDNSNPKAQNDSYKVVAGTNNPVIPVKVRPVLSWCDNYKLGNFNYGDSGNRVTTLQNCLKEARYFDYPGGATGYYGNYSSAKQEEWIKQKDVCRYMYGADFQYGETSLRVKYLQQCMRNDGYFTYPGGNTGYFGPLTQDSFNRWK